MKNKLKANLYQYLCITPAMLRTMRLCYKTERNQIVLTEEMTDDFDLERMVNGDPKCWFASRPVLGDELKKKIIISDWSFIHPSILQPTEYKLRLSLFYTLLAKDFELFIWNNGLIKINSLLELIQQLSQVSPAHLDTIWEYLRDLHDREFELDKVAILDESQTRKFLNLACAGELSNENELDLFCWRELPLAKIKSIIASLDVANEFTVKLSGYHEDISDTIRMVQARVELRKLVLSGDYWNILCRSHAQMAEKIFSDIFTAPWYASIQQLGFEGINLDEFSRFVLGKQWLPPSLTEWTSTNVTASVQTLSVLLPNSPALRVKVYDKETFSQAIMEVTIAKLRDVVINSRFDLIKFREEIDKSDDLHYDCLVLSIGDEAYEKYHTDGLYILEKLASLKV
ncbi:MAG: hypothetical protein HWD59_10215 [Coxiellaceae bacterium]|nr:MAG: hypothetical protein HWD59_10215 [Coxiellaceae bacterium]